MALVMTPETFMVPPSEQQVVDEVKTALFGEKLAGSHEAGIMMIARLAFKAGNEVGHDNGDIPQRIYAYLPKIVINPDVSRPNDVYERFFVEAMGNFVYRQEVRWAYGQGARSNG